MKDGKVLLGESIARRRRKETFESANGGTDTAATIGLVDCVKKRCQGKIYKEMMLSTTLDRKIYVCS